MHSLFGAVRLYVVSTARIERELAAPDDDSFTPSRDGAWALWARMGESDGMVAPPPQQSRVAKAVRIVATGRLRA